MDIQQKIWQLEADIQDLKIELSQDKIKFGDLFRNDKQTVLIVKENQDYACPVSKTMIQF